MDLTHYSFPKGKINENEANMYCAVRETWEEIGFNTQKYISEGDVNLYFLFPIGYYCL